MSHDFHFVMDSGMRKRLTVSDIHRCTENLSGTIKRVLALLCPVLAREHKWGEERMSRYEKVVKERSVSIHVYLDESSYRELKLLHQNLDFYSIAQLVRLVISLYLDLADIHGDRLYDVLRQMYKAWETECNHSKQTNRQKVRQLLVLLKHQAGKKCAIIIYGPDYSPFWIMRE